MLFNDFKLRSPVSISTPPIVALTQFFLADAETNLHSLMVSRYDLSPKLSAPVVAYSILNF